MPRPEDLLSAAKECFERGELAAAIVLVREVAACGDPDLVPEASHLLACVLEGQGDLEGARAAHRSVIDSGHPVFGQRSALALGLLLVGSREWAAAHRVLTSAAQGADPEAAALADTCLMLACSRLGDMEAARAALQRAQQCDSPHIAGLITGMALEDLVVELGGVTQLESLRHGDPQQRLRRGEQLLGQGSEQAAEEIFRQLLTCGNRAIVSRAAFRLYPLYAARKEYAAAREVAEHAIAAGDPGEVAMAQHLLAGALVDLGEYRQALAAERLAAADPRPSIRLPALIEEAKITGNSLGDTDTAKAILRRVIASGDAEYAATAHACLGQIHTEAGEVAQAVAEWRAVPDSGEPEHAPAAVAFLSSLPNETHDGSPFRKAILAAIDAACEHADTDAVSTAKTLVESCAGTGGAGLASARGYFQAAIEAGADNAARVELDLADLLAGPGAADEARDICERLSGHENAVVLVRYIGFLKEQGDDEALLALTELAAADARGLFRSLFGSLLGMLQSEHGDAGEALRTLRSAAEGGEPVALLMLAQTLVTSGELAEGREVYQRAATAPDPGISSRAWIGLGRTLRDDDEERARECYLHAVDAPDRHTAAAAAMLLGAIAKRHRDYAAALPWYQRVIDSGDSQAPLAAGHLGELCYWLGDRDGAVRFYELTLATTDRSELIGEAAFRLGEIRHRDGDIEAARELLNRAASADDDDFSPQARELLSQLGWD